MISSELVTPIISMDALAEHAFQLAVEYPHADPDTLARVILRHRPRRATYGVNVGAHTELITLRRERAVPLLVQMLAVRLQRPSAVEPRLLIARTRELDVRRTAAAAIQPCDVVERPIWRMGE